ncbi:MAG TPA: hypothetical protein VFJ82_03185 [Longimicrobium sp.]|nr:hypothetical protein [Longimicrobium sp.]
MLNPGDLTVETFPTTDKAMLSSGGGFCCTGCTSGCGINPTAGGCESGNNSGDFACMDQVAVD